jgi:hypothetical protein
LWPSVIWRLVVQATCDPLHRPDLTHLRQHGISNLEIFDFLLAIGYANARAFKEATRTTAFVMMLGHSRTCGTGSDCGCCQEAPERENVAPRSPYGSALFGGKHEISFYGH